MYNRGALDSIPFLQLSLISLYLPAADSLPA